MRVEIARSLRAKMAWAFILSVAGSILGLAVLWVLAGILHRYRPLRAILDILRVFPGIPTLIAIVGAALLVAIFLAITKPTARYLDEISRTLQQMEEGNWSCRIPVRSQDELGLIANGVNRMAAALGQSVSDMRKAEQARSELVTSVSHDLRTPLTSIIGYLGLMVGGADAKYASIAHQKALRLQELIDDLFEFTRLNFGGVKRKEEPIDLWGLVAQVAEELYPLFEDADMVCRIPPPRRMPVIADGAMLARAFENLFVNALRYGRQGRFVDVEFDEHEGAAAVRIRNYGEPIPQKDLPRIFDRFYRVDKARTTSSGGTGLGLAIVRSIVELHGGTVSASSGEAGTCFEVVLPSSSHS